MGVPATGTIVKFSIIMLLRVSDGKIIEKRSYVEVHDILRQLNT
ncbi:ester cyclase [Peribacillus butanolivorans]